MAQILVFSGAGHYADPWHPFGETSAAIAALLRKSGHDVVVRDSEPGSLLDLPEFDLLVVNSGGRTGDPDPARTRAWTSDHQALMGFHRSGSPILGVHTAVGTFPDWDGWPSIIGGRWTKDSFHPEMGMATFDAAGSASSHPVWAGLETVTAIDERYSLLNLADGSVPLVQQMTDGQHHAMGWAVGETVLYDGLGHDGRSYESVERCRLLQNEVDWLLACRKRT